MLTFGKSLKWLLGWVIIVDFSNFAMVDGILLTFALAKVLCFIYASVL